MAKFQERFPGAARDLDSALQMARDSKKCVWLLLSAPWSEEFRRWRTEVFESPEIEAAKADFIVLELERDAHVELDQAAQFLLQNLAARSGWPVNLFLSPGGLALMGATSLTKESLSDLLRQLKMAWWADAASLETMASQQRDSLLKKDPLHSQEMTFTRGELDEWLGEKVTGAILTPLEQSLDFETGFVGQGEAYLYPAVYKCLLERKEAGRWAEVALSNLAKSHLCDVIGGGFYRAAGRLPDQPVSTEKLLVENAELLEAYVRYKEPKSAEFFIQVASEIVRLIVDEFKLKDGLGFASSLSGEVDHYRVRPEELLAALPPRERQPAQMFFGVESSHQVPFLATDLPMLSSFLSIPPVDLSHLLTASKKVLLAKREHKAPLTRGPRLRYPEASAVRALFRAAAASNAVISVREVERVGYPIIENWTTPESFTEDRKNPRACWATVAALLAAARHALGAGDRHRFLGFKDAADEFLLANLSLNSIRVSTHFVGDRWDIADHTGHSAAGLMCQSIFDRLELAELEGDRKGVDQLQAALRLILGTSLKLCRPLGLMGASVYTVFLRYRNRINQLN